MICSYECTFCRDCVDTVLSNVCPNCGGGPPDPDFARQRGLRLPLRLAMTALSHKTRRAARRHGVRYSFLFMRASGAQLEEITKLIETNVLRPILDRTYRFDEAPQALAHVEGGRTKGKVVITMV